MAKIVKQNSAPTAPASSLFVEIRALIEASRRRVAVGINAELSMLYWHIGRRINVDVLGNERAEYGKKTVALLARQLTVEYGKGWSVQQLRHCMRFAEAFPDTEKVSTLWRELSWSHIKEILYIEDNLKRDFYLGMCRIERWSVRVLRERIDSMLYERTAISKKPEETIKNDLARLGKSGEMTPELVFRDPYFLDFLGLKDTFSEKDLESAILAELQRFIIECGTDFAFLARQKRITIDNEDYYMDLLFYHRRLRRLIVIELKLGDFKAEYKAQMEVYLRWLSKNDRHDGEGEPLGLILCAGKKQELVELLELGKSGIHVAEYLTELPPRELLEKKLLEAIKIARERVEVVGGGEV